MDYSTPKGVFDILPEEPSAENIWRSSEKWQYIENILSTAAHEYGFKEIRTPTFEKTELFIRGVGETTDIVSKEMYTFEDKGGRSMTLRPEGTAPVMRAYIEKNLQHFPSCQKLYYIESMFRYERPQAGRYREHHQFGIEAIGTRSPEQDAEVIDLLCEIYRRLGLKNLSLQLNSVGDEKSRIEYKKALLNFLEPQAASLSAESQARLSKNILRILDSKDPQDQAILKNAPSILSHLSVEAKEHFEQLQHLLKLLKIEFVINPRLVRGLDYYNYTVFEVVAGELGAQNSIGGGGRYDGLLSLLGGPSLPSVGFAIGLERVLQTMVAQKVSFPLPPHPEIFLIGLDPDSREFCFSLLAKLRKHHIVAEMELQGRKIQSALQLAAKLHAKFVLVIGEQERRTNQAKLKEMATHQETSIDLTEILSIVKAKV